MKSGNALFSSLLAFRLCLALVMPADTAEIDLYEIANSTIQFTETVQESGALVRTCENLNGFIAEVKNNYPEIAELDLAMFIMEFTGQNSDGLSESEILEILEYDNISTSSSFLLINDEEDTVVEISEEQAMTMQLADSWVSNDNLLQLETGYSKTKTVGTAKYYTIWSRATWLICNPNGRKDLFVLGCSKATSDDSFNEQGNVNRSYSCVNCSKTINKYSSVDSNSRVSGDLSLNYSDYVPYLRFFALTPYCDSCVYDDYSSTKCNSFKAYIKYGVIVEGGSNLQATYGRQTKGTADLNLSINLFEGPSINITTKNGEVRVYNARYVTLN